MSKKNLIMLNSMMRLSRIIRNSKDARRNLDLVVDQTGYFIVAGESSNMIQVQAKASISNILFVEQYLRSSVSSICVHLDGFDPGRMDPIDYISSNDIKMAQLIYAGVRRWLQTSTYLLETYFL